MANYTFPNSENPVSITANGENIFATISRGYEEPMSVQSLTFQKESELFTGQLFASWTITAVLVGVVVIAILCLIGILLFLRKIKKANTR